MSHELCSQPDFVITDELLGGLEPAQPPSASTEYLIHPDYPGLWVKASRGGWWGYDLDIDEVRTEFRTYDDLAVEGLRIVPFSVLKDGDDLKIMAHRVDGVPLADELSRNPAVAQAYDQVLARQIAKLGSLRGQDKLYPGDVYHPWQCMWGKLWGTDGPPEIIFVDIQADGSFIDNLAELASDELYFTQLELKAGSLARVKEELSVELPYARNEIIRQLDALSSATPALQPDIQALQALLRQFELPLWMR